MFRLAGETEIVKSGAATTKLTVVVCETVPLVPVMVRGYVPPGVVEEVVTVNVDDPVPLIDVGLKLADAPDGNPLILRDITPVKPFKAVVDTV